MSEPSPRFPSLATRAPHSVGSRGSHSTSRSPPVAAVELSCSFCTATFLFEANLSQHVSRFHADAVAFDTPLASHVAGLGANQGLPSDDGAECDEFGASVAPAGHVRDDGRLAHAERRGDVGGTAIADAGGRVVSASSCLRRVRHVFYGTTSALVYRYFLAKRDIDRAEPLVPSNRQGGSTKFVTPELKAIRLLALSTGGRGMSEKARVEYYNSVSQAEAVAAAAAKTVVAELEDQLATSSDSSSSSTSGSSASTAATGSSSSRPSRRPKKDSLRQRLRNAIRAAKSKAKEVKGPLTAAFPTAAAFVHSLKGEQDRCLSEMRWHVTDIVDGDSFKFYFRDIMDVAHDAFGRAEKVQLQGKQHLDADGSRLRSNSLDSDVYLVQQADVLKIHASAVHQGKHIKAFAMAVQFFSDATLLSWNGGELGGACRLHLVYACLLSRCAPA